jgi:hypothetical protein
MEKSMNENKLKQALSAVLQYGWLWGNPKHITRENWVVIAESYKDLNDGKDFEPDRSQKAT